MVDLEVLKEIALILLQHAPRSENYVNRVFHEMLKCIPDHDTPWMIYNGKGRKIKYPPWDSENKKKLFYLTLKLDHGEDIGRLKYYMNLFKQRVYQNIFSQT